jgi:hypothetical protein
VKTEVRVGRTYCIDSFLILYVVSRNSVSLGGSLWKTTLDIDDLPLLKPESAHEHAKKWIQSPPLPHEQQSWLAISGLAVGHSASVVLLAVLNRRLICVGKVLQETLHGQLCSWLQQRRARRGAVLIQSPICLVHACLRETLCRKGRHLLAGTTTHSVVVQSITVYRYEKCSRERRKRGQGRVTASTFTSPTWRGGTWYSFAPAATVHGMT